MSVNYAPQGSPSFFKGGKHPTEADISLEFGEVEPVTREDAQKGDMTMGFGTNSVNKPIPLTDEAPKPAAPAATKPKKSIPPAAANALDLQNTVSGEFGG